MKLPKVDNGTLWSVAHRLEELAKIKEPSCEYQRIVNENPEIFRFLETAIENNPYSDYRNMAIICGALVYLVLESQIEADKLKEIFA